MEKLLCARCLAGGEWLRELCTEFLLEVASCATGEAAAWAPGHGRRWTVVLLSGI